MARLKNQWSLFSKENLYIFKVKVNCDLVLDPYYIVIVNYINLIIHFVSNTTLKHVIV